jgi:hypothetical protein
MERFITMVTNEDVQRRLGHAIDGKGAFRRFKDVLMTFADEREHWFNFRSERLRVFMEAWLAAHGLRPTEREVAPTPPESSESAEEQEQPAVDQDLLSGRKQRGSEALRHHLGELADTMMGRDLEKVVAFAEFLKARRAARHQSHRADSSHKPIAFETSVPELREAQMTQLAPAPTSSRLPNSTAAPQEKMQTTTGSANDDEPIPPSQRRAADRR